MSAPQHCIGHISTPYGDAAILVGRYPAGGAIAIQLVDDEDPSEPLATFSTNLVPYVASMAEDEFCVKTWRENEVLQGLGCRDDDLEGRPSALSRHSMP